MPLNIINLIPNLWKKKNEVKYHAPLDFTLFLWTIRLKIESFVVFYIFNEKKN